MAVINDIELLWKGEMPLWLGVREKPGKQEMFQFVLGYDHSCGRLVQCPNPGVERVLLDAYKMGAAISTPSGQGLMGAEITDAFMDFMTNEMANAWGGVSVLEIGCGSGYLLRQVRGKGAEVVGCEPGPEATLANSFGIPIIQEFFSPLLLNQRFDVIVHDNVLEHIKSPNSFIADVIRVLKPKGRLFISVPDSLPMLAGGDPGMLVHEHWNYLTEQSLGDLLSAWFEQVTISQGYPGSLYASAAVPRINSNGARKTVAFRPDSGDFELGRQYATRLGLILNKLQSRLDTGRSGSVALYGISVAAVNLIAWLNWRGMPISLFDGDPFKHGKYVPGCDQPIHPPWDLLGAGGSDISEIWVLPLTFEDRILMGLRKLLGAQFERYAVISLGDLQ